MMCFGLKDRKRAKTNHCVIVLLDDTQLVHELHASSTGQDLLDVVIKHLNLIETSYFGLKYLDSSASAPPAGKQSTEPGKRPMEQLWLDVDKSAIKQLRDVQPMTVYFAVKYYASDPCKLAEEITRYQFFLQCKQDILHSRLPITFELAVELFALAVQSELGDYDPQRHHEGYTGEFQFLINQSPELEKRVALFHRQLTGQVPATAELNFLERVKWLDLYGCELHPIQYEDNAEEYALGLNPSGVLVLRNKLKVAHYLWPRIDKTKSQGRCFLMDVIDQKASGGRNRFGFRLVDKAASRRLRHAIDAHKSFFTLVNNSATLNQLAHRQQQQHMKLSQRFRNSIRSAINVGPFAGFHHHQQQQQQEMMQQQQRLRSSMKSLSSQQMATVMQQQQQQYALDARPPPTVVRMPSRRYGKQAQAALGPGAYCTLTGANGNGLPQVAPAGNKSSGAHTMVDGQRQQALLMMNQFQQMNGMVGKSQTLKPMPAAGKLDSREAKKNPYYQMMMMAMMAQQQQQQSGRQQADVSIVPPGRHLVQPSIYKASSVVNGINQLGHHHTLGGKQQAGPAMMQFFNTQPQYPGHYRAGHESPRSTKSAINPSSAMKLASKKLAKQLQQQHQQQQMLLYEPHSLQPDVRPMLAYEPGHQQPTIYPPPPAEYYGVSGGGSSSGGYHLSTSANPSPRSVRSNRMMSRHKSKSTNENLHLLHVHQQTPAKYPPANLQQHAGKMLLATTQLMQQQQQQSVPMHHQSMRPPPPGYHSGQRGQTGMGKQRLPMGSDNESDASKRSALNANSKKRATFALNNDQANLLLSTSGLMGVDGQMAKHALGGPRPSDLDDDYCCSRSDCSSIDVDGANQRPSPAKSNPQLISNNNQRRRRTSAGGQQQQPDNYGGQQRIIDDHQEWNAIRRRHNEFLLNGSFGGQPPQDSPLLEHNSAAMMRRRGSYDEGAEEHDDLGDEEGEGQMGNDNNNNSSSGSQLVKNIANKQATPILLSMNYEQSNANNKAIQLLNLQRQQLNSQSSSSDGNKSQTSSLVDSANSSVASSPQAPGSGHHQQQSDRAKQSNKTSDSTSSTTSGYYAGSNSTGSASIDSDSQATGDINTRHQVNQSGPAKHGSQAKLSGNRYHPPPKGNYQQQQQQGFNDWHEEGTRAKIAIGSYAGRMPPTLTGTRQPPAKSTNADSRQVSKGHQKQQQQQFYLGDSNAGSGIDDCQGGQNLSPPHADGQQWPPLDQIQQHAPSSLKYVSFDV